jgi:cysteine-rich repeat protein
VTRTSLGLGASFWFAATLAATLGMSACTDDDPNSDSADADDEQGDETGPPIFEPPEPECGNGYVEEGEQCDDGNLDDGDGCDSQCQIPCGMVWEASIPTVLEDLAPFVVDLAIGPNDEIVVAGRTDALTAELDDDIWIGVWNSVGEPLWSSTYELVEGRDDLPGGVAVGPDGAVYLSATIPAEQGTDIWVGRFDEVGEVVWSVTFDGPVEGSRDSAAGMAITPMGNPVVTGSMRVGEGDGDFWVAELSPTDGAELWSATWSGEFAANGFSLDTGGPVDVGSDGTIWAMAVEYVNFDTFDVHVLAYAPGGELLGDWAPQAGVAAAHSHHPDGIAVAPDGSVYFSITRLGPGSTFWLHRLDPSDGGAAGEITWIREMPSFVDAGKDWVAEDVAVAPDGNVFVGGSLYRDDTSEASWYQAWMHRLDPEGEPLCATRHSGAGSTVLTPNLLVSAIGATSTGELIAAGRLLDVEQQRSFWVGSFRGP